MRTLVSVGLLTTALVIPAVTVAAPLAAADPISDHRVQVLQVDTYALAAGIASLSNALFTPQSAETIGSITAVIANPILDFTTNLLRPR